MDLEKLSAEIAFRPGAKTRVHSKLIFKYFADSWASWVLLVAVAVIGLDAAMLVGFMFYTVLRWYRYKTTNKIIKEEEFINYDDTVAIKTEKVPVVFESSSEIGLIDFKIPSSVATVPKPTDCTPEDVQISMYTPSEDCLNVDIKKNEVNQKYAHFFIRNKV